MYKIYQQYQFKSNSKNHPFRCIFWLIRKGARCQKLEQPDTAIQRVKYAHQNHFIQNYTNNPHPCHIYIRSKFQVLCKKIMHVCGNRASRTLTGTTKEINKVIDNDMHNP
jgi:hypothetical protein